MGTKTPASNDAAARVGISSLAGKPDLSDLGAILDECEALEVDTIELPAYDMDIVMGGRIHRPHLARLKAACAGRRVGWTVHGTLAINFMDEAHRLPRHFEVFQRAVEVAAEVAAPIYVLHTGHLATTGAEGVEAAYARQREYLVKAGDFAAQHKMTVCVENVFADHTGKKHTAGAARLAREIAAVGHRNIAATVDFSHAFIEVGCRGGDVVAEVVPLAALAPHLHIHDSFGRPDDMWAYTEGEKLAFGHGDLHLPTGWGALPWDAILAACTFPRGVTFNIELDRRYWYAARETVAATRALAAKAKVRSGNEAGTATPSDRTPVRA